MELYFTGIIIGVAVFLIIGIFHPLVIKGEYYFGTRCWWWFLIAGIITLLISLVTPSVLVSTLLAVVSASSFWSINEIFEQEQRVKKGWFPKNPKRK